MPVSEKPAENAEETVASESPIAIVEEPDSEASEMAEEVDQPAPEPPRIEEVSGPATELVSVEANRVDNATEVTIRANGQIENSSVRVSLLKNPARVWVRIQNIETFYRPNDIEVGTQEVERVRVGHHPEETPQSIYVVFDLEDQSTVVHEYAVEGDTLRVVVGRP
jgi:hypothetical protein